MTAEGISRDRHSSTPPRPPGRAFRCLPARSTPAILRGTERFLASTSRPRHARARLRPAGPPEPLPGAEGQSSGPLFRGSTHAPQGPARVSRPWARRRCPGGTHRICSQSLLRDCRWARACAYAKARFGDFRILLHARLCQDRDLQSYFLPVDFTESRQRCSQTWKRVGRREGRWRQDPRADLPRGGRSRGSASIRDLAGAPWRTFTAKILAQSRATVIPTFFTAKTPEASTSRAISQALRYALLLGKRIAAAASPAG